jgi:uncharacterized RDD family membrane protein YckC
MFCTKCGANLGEGAQFCTVCGAQVAGGPPQPPAPPSPATQPPAASTPSPLGAPVPHYAPPSYVPPAAPGYAPPMAQPPLPRPSVDYAGFWLRFVAFVIDSFLWGIPLVFFIAMMAGAMGVAHGLKNIEPGESPDDVFALLGVSFILMACFAVIVGRWFYYAIFESSNWQATPGKKALGLYVTDLNGFRITFGRASGRYFARLVTSLIPLSIGYIMAGFTEKRQALHDMIASCLVLRKL